MINGFPTNESTRKRDHTIGDENVLRRLNQQLVDKGKRKYPPIIRCFIILCIFNILSNFSFNYVAHDIYSVNSHFELTMPIPQFWPPGDYICDDNAIQSYSVCNGFSNQILGHAGFIASFIESGSTVQIPDAYITNGVQTEPDGSGALLNVFATKANSVPLTSIINAKALIQHVREYGGDACFIPHDMVISKQPKECSWLPTLGKASNQLEMDVLDAIQPSVALLDIVDTTVTKLKGSLKSSNLEASDGICLHHRDGPDWHNHCKIWNGNNCLNVDDRNIEDLVNDRIPPAYPKKWIYYIGDENPSPSMVSAFQGNNMQIVHRSKHDILDKDRLQKLFNFNTDVTIQSHRDLFAAVDFFVCSHIDSFIGNSVSTFSALQIAKRHGRNSTWYNSRSSPLLASFMQVHEIPFVYTYTELSDEMGKIFLKASILSVRKKFGFSIDINIIYHGAADKDFFDWLNEQRVIIHKHEPKWLEMIDVMISNADKTRSHLYTHRGNYIGTWQRLDIPLFINAEYCLLLDADTIVHRKFNLSDFGLDITPGIALSTELWEKDQTPVNNGVALMNVPKLRETYNDFVSFINEHVTERKDFVLGPSDQGAYLDFYHRYKNENRKLLIRRKRTKSNPKPTKIHNVQPSKYVQFLDTTFNVKPYYKLQKYIKNRRIVHFHGMKPHQILRVFMGYKIDDFSDALQVILPMLFSNDADVFMCDSLRDFGISIIHDAKLLDLFCTKAFPKENEKSACTEFFITLASRSEHETSKFETCVDIMKSIGFTRDPSIVSLELMKEGIKECVEGEALYLKQNPNAAKMVKTGELRSGFQHWLLAKEEGRGGTTYKCNVYIEATEKCDEGELMYIARNRDISRAIEEKKFESGFHHWQIFGKNEGRLYGCHNPYWDIS